MAIPGKAVDGNDILAVYVTMQEAVERARKGEGPTFIECLTLRMGPHSSSDDPTRYRDAEQFSAWEKRDPILRFQKYLERKGLWDATQEQDLREEIQDEILAAVDEAEKYPPPPLESMFEDVFKNKTPQLERQLSDLLHEKELRGKFENTSEAFPL